MTNTGPTIITGDLGVDPGTAVTGFPPGTVVGGTIHSADAVALQAQHDNTTAYNDLAAEICNTNVSTDLGGLTLVPGVYCFSSSAQLTGTVTLNGGGDPNAVWIFKIGSTLTTASNSSVVLENGAQQCNVFWQIGSSATLGTGTTFVGNIFALASITLNTTATVSGRALAQTGAVTLDSNLVSVSVCAVPPVNPIPPTLGKAFSPATINVGPTGSTLTITLSNADAAAASLTAPLIDTLPVGVVVSGSASSTCGAAPTVSTSSGLTSITLPTGASIPADSFCTVTVTDVTSPTGGSYINSLAAGVLVTNNGSNAAPAVATLTVNAPTLVAPTVSKAFSPATITVGPTGSTLTIALSNAGATTDTLTAPLIDTLPTGMVVSGTASSTCGVTPTVSTISGVTTVTLGTVVSEASIPADSFCTVTVPVNAAVGGNYINSLAAGALQTNNGSNAAPAIATLTVNTPVAGPVPPTINKAFSPATIVPGGPSTLTITLSNAGNTTDNLTAPLVDKLPSGMVVSSASATGCGVTPTYATTSGVTTVTLGTVVSEASIQAGSTCVVTVNVTAFGGGSYVNSLAAGALVTNNGTNAASAIATLTVSTPYVVTLGKAFTPATIYAGGVSTLTITLTNTNPTTAASLTAALTDKLPPGVVVAGSVSSTCTAPLTGFNMQQLTRRPRLEPVAFRIPGRMRAWLSSSPSTVSMTGGSIPAGGSCTVTVLVTAPVAGIYFNALAAGALVTSNGNNAAPALATLTVLPVVSIPPTLSKSFSPGTIKTGGISILTITLTNPNKTIAHLTEPLTDTLPSGLLTSGNVNSTCIAPLSGLNIQQLTRQPRFKTVALRIPLRSFAWLDTGTSSVSMTGGSIPANSSCTLTVNVISKNKGSYVNTLPVGALQTNLGSNTTAASATLIVISPTAPTLSKSFSPSTIKNGGVSTLTIILNNPNAIVANINLLTDNFPNGMLIASTPNASTTCGGTLTATKGATWETVGGGSIPANGSCTVTVNVTAENKGSNNNKLPVGALKTNLGNNTTAASATLTVTAK